MKNILTLFLIFLQLNFLLAQSNKEEINFKIDSIFSTSSIPAFSASIINKDSVFYQVNKGYADIESNIKLNEQHAILWASVSKTFLGVSVMKAIEEGYFTLETNINDLLPFKISNLNHPNSVITVRHLVTHTSGITDKIKDYRKVFFLEDPLSKKFKYDFFTTWGIRKASKNENLSLNKLLSEIFIPKGKFYSKKNFTKHKPGENYEYSNTAAALAAIIIEHKTGNSNKEYLKLKIFTPLKMIHSTFECEELKNDNLTVLYTGAKNYKLPKYYSPLYPIGGLYSSPQDMNKYLIEMIKGFSGKGKLLSIESYKTLFSKQLDQNNMPTGMKAEEVNQGVFWVFQDENTLGHTGGGLGASSFMFFNSSTGVGKIFITNCDLSSSQQKANAFRNIWFLLDDYKLN